jgi:hypothetical protein
MCDCVTRGERLIEELHLWHRLHATLTAGMVLLHTDKDQTKRNTIGTYK